MSFCDKNFILPSVFFFSLQSLLQSSVSSFAFSPFPLLLDPFSILIIVFNTKIFDRSHTVLLEEISPLQMQWVLAAVMSPLFSRHRVPATSHPPLFQPTLLGASVWPSPNNLAPESRSTTPNRYSFFPPLFRSKPWISILYTAWFYAFGRLSKKAKIYSVFLYPVYSSLSSMHL